MPIQTPELHRVFSLFTLTLDPLYGHVIAPKMTRLFAENSTLIKLSNELTSPFGPDFFLSDYIHK